MLQFEEYLQEFSTTINLGEFLINLLVAAILALILRWFYITYGSSITNRQKFALNFIPLALTTFLIITVIKSSLALSLGLVGALSIVRFRAAIKDPEELTYLFLTIAIGLVTGASRPLLAVVAMACILPLIYFNQQYRNRNTVSKDGLYINISTDHNNIEHIVQILENHFDYINLKRMDHRDNMLFATFLCQAKDLEQISKAHASLGGISEKTSVSFIDKPNISG